MVTFHSVWGVPGCLSQPEKTTLNGASEVGARSQLLRSELHATRHTGLIEFHMPSDAEDSVLPLSHAEPGLALLGSWVTVLLPILGPSDPCNLERVSHFPRVS